MNQPTRIDPTPAAPVPPAPAMQPHTGGQYVWLDGVLTKVGETAPAQGRRVQPGVQTTDPSKET